MRRYPYKKCVMRIDFGVIGNDVENSDEFHDFVALIEKKHPAGSESTLKSTSGQFIFFLNVPGKKSLSDIDNGLLNKPVKRGVANGKNKKA